MPKMDPMEIDHSGCEVFREEECLRLLSGESHGRLGLHAAALPVILPVSYAVVDGGIVVRTHDRSQLYEAVRDSVVAFQVDRRTGQDGGGWSVHVTGVAREVTDPAELARLRDLPLRRWAPVEAERFVRIPVDLVSGRRVVSAAA